MAHPTSNFTSKSTSKSTSHRLDDAAPKTPPANTMAGRMLEGLALLLMAAPFLLISLNWNSVPDSVPLHFNWQGEVDRWGPKVGLLVVPFVAVPAFLVLWFIGRKIGSFGQIKLPEGIDPTRPDVLALVREVYGWMMLSFAGIMAYISWSQIEAAKTVGRGFTALPVLALLAFIPPVLVIYSRRLRDLGKRPFDEKR